MSFICIIKNRFGIGAKIEDHKRLRRARWPGIIWHGRLKPLVWWFLPVFCVVRCFCVLSWCVNVWTGGSALRSGATVINPKSISHVGGMPLRSYINHGSSGKGGRGCCTPSRPCLFPFFYTTSPRWLGTPYRHTAPVRKASPPRLN
jgi:hypothetical protein